MKQGIHPEYKEIARKLQDELVKQLETFEEPGLVNNRPYLLQ